MTSGFVHTQCRSSCYEEERDREPGGKAIEVAVSRLAGTSPDKRRGVLLTNSGGAGPAFPAIPRDLGLPRSVLDSYDVIGMDPRGVGHSTPVTCGLKPEQPALRPPLAWSAKVRERAKELENGSWGAAAVNTQ